MHLRPRILPLLRGRLVVRQIVLDRPSVLLHLPDGEELELPTPARDELAPSRDASFRVERIVIRNGRIEYRDENTGRSVVLEGIEQRLRLDGTVTVGELSSLTLGSRGSSVAEVAIESPGMRTGSPASPVIQGARSARAHSSGKDRSGAPPDFA